MLSDDAINLLKEACSYRFSTLVTTGTDPKRPTHFSELEEAGFITVRSVIYGWYEVKPTEKGRVFDRLMKY